MPCADGEAPVGATMYGLRNLARALAVAALVTAASRASADWIDAGWASRLAAAMRDSGARFEGPLRSPSEPWHYAYVPVESAK